MRRLRHMIEAHGIHAVPCPRCHGIPGARCLTCDGWGEVYAIPVRPGRCAAGEGCPLLARGDA